MRIVLPERRTLPSSTAPTFNFRAMVPISVSLPLNEKADVRAATCSSLMRERSLSSSSESPSEKYSCSLSPLMFTKGSTAIECGGGLKAAAVAGAAATVCAGSAAGGVGGGACRETENLSTAMYATATATSAPIADSATLDRKGEATGPPDGGTVVDVGDAAA